MHGRTVEPVERAKSALRSRLPLRISSHQRADHALIGHAAILPLSPLRGERSTCERESVKQVGSGGAAAMQRREVCTKPHGPLTRSLCSRPLPARER